ncbi:hypothetical protein [Sphingobacterium paucimobilis]|uniref:Uncharacterized protein n=1 Tax=Sphingobacterium paucimobilis HER1398 TaxID=1346330 RepID=U2HC22_9SPHI|nr:hypothetical protein [Sphingobacterium paucimobilis]ERJ59301.1 hypothetical protein M472_11000 [Sphingobacterium paucimobilis HER1398]
MKKYLLFLLCFVVTSGFSQDVKKISYIQSTINNQHPDKFILEDEYVKITFNSASNQQINFNIFNKTDKSIDIIWTDSYFVLNGNSERVDNAGVSKIEMGMFHTAQVDNMKPQKIAPESNFLAKMKAEKAVFDFFGADNHYKKMGVPLVNRVVPALQINGEIKEYPITLELYPKKYFKDKKKT